jgi:GNAT superfamily N-acetyltransferase
MDIEHVDGRRLDAATAQSIADLTNAAVAVEAPHLEPVGAEKIRLDLEYGWEMDGTEHVFLARDESGALVGYAELDWPTWDNTELNWYDLLVHPDSDHATVADALLEAAEPLVREAGRSKRMGGAWVGSARERYWRSRGFEAASRSAQRRLYPDKLDWPALDALHARSLEASQDYDVIALPAPTPDEYMQRYLDLHLAMNDAPLDDLEIEDEVWTIERHRRHEEALTKRKLRTLTLAAIRRSDGVLGGHTVVVIELDRPDLGFQEDTAVIAAHRGHRLGMRLKIEMLELLRDTEPQIRQIDTWNAESNSHMISVNDAIGCVVVGRSTQFQKAAD